MAYTTTAEFYDSISSKYQEVYGHCQDHIQFVHQALELLAPHASVLDVGCGSGEPTARMVAASGRNIHGIDFSPKMISLCRNQVPNGTFEVADVLEYQPASPFDAAMATFSLLNFSHEQMTSLFAKFYGWINPHGYLFIGTLHSDGCQAAPEASGEPNEHGARLTQMRFMGNSAPILLYDDRGWKLLLENAGFEVITTSMALFEPPLEAESDSELHYYIIARKKINDGTDSH